MALTLVGCGTAIVSDRDMVLIALALGPSVVAMAYCIGRVSGCHINPAITVGMLMDGMMEKEDAAFYIVA